METRIRGERYKKNNRRRGGGGEVVNNDCMKKKEMRCKKIRERDEKMMLTTVGSERKAK